MPDNPITVFRQANKNATTGLRVNEKDNYYTMELTGLFVFIKYSFFFTI